VAEVRSGDAPGLQATRVKELEERLDDQARRIQELEARLERGEEQIVNFQVFVQKLSIQGGQASARPTSTPSGQAPDSAPVLPELSPGAPQAAVLASLGPPDERSERELNYYEKGVRVLLDEFGAIERVELFGEATGAGGIDANGNRSGQFERGGKWYRPAKWELQGVRMGSPGEEVVRRLGYPKSIERDSMGLFHLWYPTHQLKIVLALEAPQRVVQVRRGAKPPAIDANGFVD
jgi:hypothetical protein